MDASYRVAKKRDAAIIRKHGKTDGRSDNDTKRLACETAPEATQGSRKRAHGGRISEEPAKIRRVEEQPGHEAAAVAPHTSTMPQTSTSTSRPSKTVTFAPETEFGAKPPPARRPKQPPFKTANPFKGLRVMVLPGGGRDLSRSRAKLLEELIEKNGGAVVRAERDIDADVVIVASKDRILEKLSHSILKARRFVTPNWVSQSIHGCIRPCHKVFDRPRGVKPKPQQDPDSKKASGASSSGCNGPRTATLRTKSVAELRKPRVPLKPSGSPFFETPMEKPEQLYTIEEFREMIDKDTWVDKRKDSLACQKNLGEFGSHGYNANDHITSVLKELMSIYSALAEAPLYTEGGGRKTKGNEYYWKVFSMKKVIGILENYPNPLRTSEDLEELKMQFKSSGGGKRGRKGIGKKTWDKIWEIMQTGGLQRITFHKGDPKISAILDFTKIWGVGAKTAASLWKRGFDSLEDLKRRHDEARLNNNQQVGLKHFDDLQQRIPRAEVEEIELCVRRHAEAELPGLTLVTCGSFRRGAPSSGDVDILMSHGADRKKLLGTFLPNLVRRLRIAGFLTDELSHGFHHSKRKHESQTCFGVCRLPSKNGKKRLHRRLDLKVYPREQFAFAILYFTGSDHFNRSMRWYAHRKGLTLSDHGLAKATRINREKVWEGHSVFCETEEEIFYVLDLEFVEPTKRNVQHGTNRGEQPAQTRVIRGTP